MQPCVLGPAKKAPSHYSHSKHTNKTAHTYGYHRRTVHHCQRISECIECVKRQVHEKRYISSRSWRKQEDSLLPSIQSAKLLHIFLQISVAMRLLLLVAPISSILAIIRHIYSLWVPAFTGVTTTILWTTSGSPIQQFELICWLCLSEFQAVQVAAHW